MYYVTYEFNGIEFDFINDYILISPERHDFSNPAVTEALRLASAAQPAIDAIEEMRECLLYETFNWPRISDSLATFYFEKLSLIVRQDQVPIPDWAPSLHIQCLADQERRKVKRAEEEERQRKRAGYVYLIQSPAGFYKIGRTKNPEDRLRLFGVKLPFEIALETLIQTDDMFALERKLHRRFKDKRADGEWFNLASEDVEYIRALGGTDEQQ